MLGKGSGQEEGTMRMWPETLSALPFCQKMVYGEAILISQGTDGASDGTSHPPSPQFPELIFIDAHPFLHIPANQWGSEMLRRELDKVLAGTALSVGPTFPPSDSAASSDLAAPGLIATAGWGTENEKKYSTDLMNHMQVVVRLEATFLSSFACSGWVFI